MDFGNKLKNSRVKSRLSQEEVADKLNVTRQTISNWENNRSYPDILNVIELSNLYHISIDKLIKEDEKIVKYLSDSTDTVKAKNKLFKIILLSSYLIIWALILIAFWFFPSGGDEKGYSLMAFYIILPIITFVISFIIGKDGSFGKKKYLIPLLLGIMYAFSEYTTFVLANISTFGEYYYPEITMIIGGIVISYISLGIGLLCDKNRKNNKSLIRKVIVSISFILLVVIFILMLYNHVINPYDTIGYRCQTGYNLNTYDVFGIKKFGHDEEVDIPDNSCFVAKCCMTSVIFRSKMPYDELEKELEILEKTLNETRDSKVTVGISENNYYYREYYIQY